MGAFYATSVGVVPRTEVSSKSGWIVRLSCFKLPSKRLVITASCGDFVFIFALSIHDSHGCEGTLSFILFLCRRGHFPSWMCLPFTLSSQSSSITSGWRSGFTGIGFIHTLYRNISFRGVVRKETTNQYRILGKGIQIKTIAPDKEHLSATEMAQRADFGSLRRRFLKRAMHQRRLYRT